MRTFEVISVSIFTKILSDFAKLDLVVISERLNGLPENIKGDLFNARRKIIDGHDPEKVAVEFLGVNDPKIACAYVDVVRQEARVKNHRNASELISSIINGCEFFDVNHDEMHAFFTVVFYYLSEELKEQLE